MEKRKLKLGQSVVYFDSYGKPGKALVTNIFHQYVKADERHTGLEVEFDAVGGQYPCLNLLFISKDVTRRDDCGRQMERNTSVIHKTHTPAQGNYWIFEDEFEGEL